MHYKNFNISFSSYKILKPFEYNLGAGDKEAIMMIVIVVMVGKFTVEGPIYKLFT